MFFPFYSIIGKLLKESLDLYLTSSSEWKAVMNTFNAFSIPQTSKTCFASQHLNCVGAREPTNAVK